MQTLDFAKNKIRGVIDTLDEVIALDFPFRHAKDALAEIKSTFAEIQRTLESLGPENSPQAVKTYCQRSLEILAQQLPAIGFIARSTEISGPVEFHGPFLRIVRQAVGKDSKLVISSEWDFSPYTFIFPELFHDQQFVLVGLPVSESDNALITPLAGHELGHNIWVNEGYDTQLERSIYKGIQALIEGKYWPQFKEQFRLEDKSQIEGDLFATLGWENSVAWALAQCEEVFSDVIGLLIFREAYLYAFAYLISPWGFGRTERRYPDMQDRIGYMLRAAEKTGISVPDGYRDLFAAKKPGGIDDFLLSISDEAVQQTLDNLIELGSTLVSTKGLVFSIEDVDQIIQDFRKGIPATNAKSIVSILNAGWRLRSNGANPWGNGMDSSNENFGWHTTLNELLLKSFEVFEIEQRQATEICLTAQQSFNY